jgi:hypothetical protein
MHYQFGTQIPKSPRVRHELYALQFVYGNQKTSERIAAGTGRVALPFLVRVRLPQALPLVCAYRWHTLGREHLSSGREINLMDHPKNSALPHLNLDRVFEVLDSRLLIEISHIRVSSSSGIYEQNPQVQMLEGPTLISLNRLCKFYGYFNHP